ncbi:hypothetical protein BC828DRAFT_226657 [Blastocladiella britannica]|nr:hypothetical protein BC828DRAFT_226657 [Blastocladiella britannica]
MPLHATTPLSEWTQKTTLEHDYCRDFSCCGLRLTDLFALLDHYESCHMACNDMYSSSESSSVASSTSDLSAAATPAVKAMDAKSAITRTSSNRLPPTPPPELVRGGDASLAPGSVPFVLANAPASRKRSHTTTFQADDDETDLESCSALRSSKPLPRRSWTMARPESDAGPKPMLFPTILRLHFNAFEH